MDQDLIAYLDERFGENAKQIDTLRQEMSGLRQEMSGFRQETSERFEVVEGAIRQTHVAVEGLRGDIQLLAEGIIGMEEKAQSFRNEATLPVRGGPEINRALFPTARSPCCLAGGPRRSGRPSSPGHHPRALRQKSRLTYQSGPSVPLRPKYCPP
jgi:hypothetical protein